MAVKNLAQMLQKQFGDSTGPLGFPMRSEDARELETIIEQSPKECKDMGLKRMTSITKAADFDEGEHSDISFVTTSALDRDREVVLANGVDWKQFRKNPIVTFAHMYDCLPLGKCLWVKSEKRNDLDGWLAKTKYSSRPTVDLWPADEPWFSDAVWHFVKNKELPGKSIGFIVLSARAPTDKEIKSRPELANCRVIFDKTMALEYAVAPVQSNPDALVMQVAKCRKSGMKIPDRLLDALGMIVPDTIDDIVDAPAPAPAPQQKKQPTFVSLSAVKKSVLEKVGAGLDKIDISSLVDEAMNIRKGKV